MTRKILIKEKNIFTEKVQKKKKRKFQEANQSKKYAKEKLKSKMKRKKQKKTADQRKAEKHLHRNPQLKNFQTPVKMKKNFKIKKSRRKQEVSDSLNTCDRSGDKNRKI